MGTREKEIQIKIKKTKTLNKKYKKREIIYGNKIKCDITCLHIKMNIKLKFYFN